MVVMAFGRNELSYGGACVSFCPYDYVSGGVGSCRDDTNGFSPGNGCCQTPIPKGSRVVQAYLTDSHGSWGKSKRFPCSYAFVGEKSRDSGFSYPLHNLDNSTAFLDANQTANSMSPLVLEWRIGDENCSLAQQNATTYACQQNTNCVDANAGGYLCRCSEGFEGNPYLNHGCQDIDECANTNNTCQSICINTPGSYTCACPRGSTGDGTKDGRGCSNNPPGFNILTNILIGLGSGIGFIFLLSFIIWFHKAVEKEKKRIQKENFFKRNGGLILEQQTLNDGTLWETKHFSANELEKATDHFNENRVLGQGGQGTVYKGMLSDGRIVAIKKSKLVDESQLEPFINEVVILSQINHRNVVKLLGCCLETEVPLLVYEFLPNGTLFDLIHDANAEFSLSWDMRLKIATDIAGALAYLHSASCRPIYHRDIKSSNILLDAKYVVKVSDFGTSTLVKGTFGYLDPEYFQSSQFTEKSDVYSFGVVLVELLTGQRPISLDRTEEEKSLATRFLVSMEDNSLESLLDPQVSRQCKNDQVTAVARLAQSCLNLQGKWRPTMKEAATKLESLRLSEIPSTVRNESKSRFLEDNSMVSDMEYTWTTSNGDSLISSPSDEHPFIFETI